MKRGNYIAEILLLHDRSFRVHKTNPMEPEIAGNLARVASLLARAMHIPRRDNP
jgi:hypothetical protein